MLTIKEFIEKHNLKSEKVVMEWVKKNYIPYLMAEGQILFSDYANPPYLSRRAKNPDSIYTSMVNACLHRKGITASLYNLSEKEFEIYTSELVKRELLIEIVEDENHYYFPSTMSKEYVENKKGLSKFIKEIFKTTITATTTAYVATNIK